MNITSLLRWVAVLPASLIAAVLSWIILLILVLIGDLFSGSLWLYIRHPEIIYFDHFFLSFMLSATFGYIFVSAGAATSPRYKRIVAFVLFAIIAIVFGFFMVLLFATNFAESWRLIVNSTVCVIASGFSAYFTENEE